MLSSFGSSTFSFTRADRSGNSSASTRKFHRCLRARSFSTSSLRLLGLHFVEMQMTAWVQEQQPNQTPFRNGYGEYENETCLPFHNEASKGRRTPCAALQRLPPVADAGEFTQTVNKLSLSPAYLAGLATAMRGGAVVGL